METKIEDMEVKLAKCAETQCERQGVLLLEQGERIRSLKADRGQVGPVSLGEVRGLHDAGVCMPSLGVVEAARSLGLMRAPSMTVPTGVRNACLMAWESKQDGAERAQTQTGGSKLPGQMARALRGWGAIEIWGVHPSRSPSGTGGGGPQKDQGCHCSRTMARRT